MTRRHVEAIAAAIKQARTINLSLYANGVYATDRTAMHIADAIEGINPSFDRARFLRDCGVTS